LRFFFFGKISSCNFTIIINITATTTTGEEVALTMEIYLSPWTVLDNEINKLLSRQHTHTHTLETATYTEWNTLEDLLAMLHEIFSSSSKRSEWVNGMKKRKKALKIAWRHQFLNFHSETAEAAEEEMRKEGTTYSLWMRIEWLLLDQ
jgi:hypothetical protein